MLVKLVQLFFFTFRNCVDFFNLIRSFFYLWKFFILEFMLLKNKYPLHFFDVDIHLKKSLLKGIGKTSGRSHFLHMKYKHINSFINLIHLIVFTKQVILTYCYLSTDINTNLVMYKTDKIKNKTFWLLFFLCS